jgi:hypothetical protein
MMLQRRHGIDGQGFDRPDLIDFFRNFFRRSFRRHRRRPRRSDVTSSRVRKSEVNSLLVIPEILESAELLEADLTSGRDRHGFYVFQPPGKKPIFEKF